VSGLSTRRLTAPAALATVLISLLLGLLPVTAAEAAVAAPRGLTPSGGLAAGIPALEWNRVKGATTYNVQLSDTPEFTTVRQKATTANRRWVPTAQLPSGEVWWRVQAVAGRETGPWSTTSFERDRLAGPVLLSPADGHRLDQPEEPALLAWHPVNGATGYTVEIDDAADFIGATSYTTKTSSYVVPNPQVATTYFWRVRATLASGVVTDHSDAWTYELSGLDEPVLVGPADSALTSVEDVVLDWEPVKGAATYDLQVSTDVNFNTVDESATTVRGTRWSPKQTLENDQYFWRVRPVDTLGNKLDWGQVDVWQFRRHWPDQPVLEHPVDDAVVGDPFFYQWTAVDKASSYELQMSTSSDFPSGSPKRTWSCTTVQTTFVPNEDGDCFPGAYGTYYWRVIALDAYNRDVTEESQPIPAQVGRFSYAPPLVGVDTATPADGATVQVPTLTWEPVALAAKYKVFVTEVDSGDVVVNGKTTATTSYTPRDLLTPGTSYRWWVQTVSQDGRLGPVMVPEAQPVLHVAEMDEPTAVTPDLRTPAPGATVVRMPAMTWSPVVGAASYRIGLRPSNTIQAFTDLTDAFEYPAGEDVSTLRLSPGSYDWRVSAYAADGRKLSDSAPRSFTVTSLPAVTGARAAMTGTAAGSDETSCTAVLPARCEELPQTPVLAWDPVPGAGGYVLHLSRDKEMTNVISSLPLDTTMWTPTSALKDSQAGDAYYWQVQPCTVADTCRAWTEAPWAFNKRSNPVELEHPAPGATVENDVTLRWTDYLVTNAKPAAADAQGVNPRVEAMHYRVEVSQVPNFQSKLDEIEVDQTTYTASTRTYPEGTLYWRVAAVDGSDNDLTFSEPRSFTKSSPVPTLLSPTHGSAVAHTEPFRWESLDFAANYDIEVYRNGDTVGQSANRVFYGNSKQVAFTTTTPLPASSQPYTWRIRRVDASNRDGAWTSLADPAARFRVQAPEPLLTGPAAGSVVVGNDALFTWDTTDGATSYRFERRAAGATSVAETVTTAAVAHAPVKAIADGAWQWRVSTLDAAGKVLASAPWRAFSVDGTAPRVTSGAPAATATSASNVVARFSERVTGVSGSTFTVTLKGTPSPVRAKVTLSANGRKAVLDPKRALKRGRTYTVRLTKAIADPAGNRLTPYSWKVRVR
jgi:hypothetical protein